MHRGLPTFVPLSNRVKTGLLLGAISVVIIGISYYRFVSSLEEWGSDDLDCSGWNPLDPISSIYDIECDSDRGEDGVLDYGCCSCFLGIILAISAAWILLSAFLGLIFGKKAVGGGSVEFVAPPTEPPIEDEDEFAHLEAELDSLDD